MATNINKYQTKEVLNRVLNSGEDALKVDIDNVTLDGTQLSVDIDEADDSILAYGFDGAANQKVATDTSGNVKTTHSISGVGEGRKESDTSAVAIATTTACRKVDITAELDNTDIVVVGGSSVVAVAATRTGTPLRAGDSYSLEIDDLADVYIRSVVNGEGVTFTYYT
jgi:hypothetical protein